ncbi:MAG: FMN-binding protein [Oscillospiraceae bacterium]
MTFSADAITDVTVVEHSETAGLSDRPIAEIPAAIVENRSLAVDTVSGATNSSTPSPDRRCGLRGAGEAATWKRSRPSRWRRRPLKMWKRRMSVVVLGGGGAGPDRVHHRGPERREGHPRGEGRFPRRQHADCGPGASAPAIRSVRPTPR